MTTLTNSELFYKKVVLANVKIVSILVLSHDTSKPISIMYLVLSCGSINFINFTKKLVTKKSAFKKDVHTLPGRKFRDTFKYRGERVSTLKIF